jgi:hypothetical protein
MDCEVLTWREREFQSWGVLRAPKIGRWDPNVNIPVYVLYAFV